MVTVIEPVRRANRERPSRAILLRSAAGLPRGTLGAIRGDWDCPWIAPSRSRHRGVNVLGPTANAVRQALPAHPGASMLSRHASLSEVHYDSAPLGRGSHSHRPRPPTRAAQD